jgi:hypothetical protein
MFFQSFWGRSSVRQKEGGFRVVKNTTLNLVFSFRDFVLLVYHQMFLGS